MTRRFPIIVRSHERLTTPPLYKSGATGLDVITDFTLNQDKLNLAGSLNFSQLNISPGTDININDTIIQYQVNGEYLAVLKGITASSIVQEIFL